MATSSNRDVRLGIEIETAGEDGIRGLASEVRALAKTGGPAAAEFSRLAGELDRLADQSAATSNLQRLVADVERLTAAERLAADAAATTAARYNEQRAAVEGLREAQTRARGEVAQAKRAVDDLKQSLDQQIAAGRLAGDSQQQLAARTNETRTALIDQTRALKLRKDGLAEANRELATAVAAEDKLRQQFEQTGRAAATTRDALTSQSAALVSAGQAAERFGVDLDDLEGSQRRFSVQLERAIQQKQEYQAQTQRAAQYTDLWARALDDLDVQAAAAAAEIKRLDDANAAAAAALQDRLAGTAAAYERDLALQRQRAAAAERAAASQQAAADDALQFVLALEREEQAARDAAARLEELNAKAARLKDGEARVAAMAAALDEIDAAAAQSAESMRLLEQGAQRADREFEQLAASLRTTEQAAREYTAATERAAAAGADDVAAQQQRVRAAEALIASERELTAAQRDLAAQRDRNRAGLVAEAQALLAAKRAADEARAATAALVRESQALGTALDGTGRSIGRIGEVTRQAFGQTGVRSLQDIEAEIADVDRALSLLERRFRTGQVSAEDLARATSSAQVRLAALKREAETIPSVAGGFERISTSINGLLTRFGALSAAIATVGIAAKPVLDATIALEQMRRVLTTVTGSAEQAEQQIEFLRQTSTQAGQSFTEVGASYAKFAASALQSGLSIQQTQDVFRSVALAAGNLGLSSDQAKRALEALSQIASKGTVSMEELRQQLGDALPGVLPLLAKELGLTQAELNKVVESGQLLASEAIPAIGRALTSLQPASGTVNGLVAEWNRFTNAIKQAGTEIVEGPLGRAVAPVLGVVADAVKGLGGVAVATSAGVQQLGQAIAAFFALVSGDLSLREFREELSRIQDQAQKTLRSYTDTAFGAAEGTQALTRDVVGLGQSFARLALDQQRAIDQAALAAQSAEKNVQAKKAEAEATSTLADLIGDETTKREAAVAAAAATAAAVEAQARADEALVRTLVQAREATEAKAKAEGLGRDAIKATVDALNDKIVKATADAEKTRAQADAARAQAAALDLAAKSIRNNADRIDDLKKSVEAAELALASKVRAMRLDATTSEEVRRAAEALAKAKGLLRDAIDDVAEALQRQIEAMRSDVALARAGLQLELERAKNAEREALAVGNAARARQEAIRAKELENQITRIGNDLKIQEAEATLRALDQQEQELRLLGQLTPEKEREIEAKRKVALAAVLEAQANREANKEKEKEVDLLKLGGSARAEYEARVKAAREAVEKDTGALTGNTSARDANTSAIGRQIKAVDAYGNALSQLAKDAGQIGPDSTIRSPGGDANKLASQGGSDLSVLNKTPFDLGGQQLEIPEGGFFDQAAFLRESAFAARAGLAAPDPSRFIREAGGPGGLDAVNAELARLRAAQTSALPAPTPAPAPSTAGGQTTTINLTINGRPFRITTPAGQAEALVRELAELANAAGG